MSNWNSGRREWRRGDISRVTDDERYESLETEAHSLLTRMNRYKPIPKYVSLTLQNAKTKEFKSCKEKKQRIYKIMIVTLKTMFLVPTMEDKTVK